MAPVMPLARGWERQLDEADNPLFYGGAGDLDAGVLPAWLLDNGVRFVALPDAPLDFAGTAEARLVAAGVPGLDLIWRSPHWRLYQVEGSSGIVAAPGPAGEPERRPGRGGDPGARTGRGPRPLQP